MGNSKWKHLFTEEEWKWAHKTSQSIHDPKEKREFWENLIEVKQSQSTEESPMSEKEKMARKYCGPILEMLRRGKRE